MKNILLLFLLAFSTSGFSQLVLDTIGVASGTAGDDLINYTFTVTNEGTETATFYWHLDRETVPRGWAFTVCDAIICYQEGQETSICGDPQFANVLAPGVSIPFYKVSVKPNGEDGSAPVTFTLTTECGNTDPENVIGQLDLTFNVEPVSSVENIDNLSESLLIYPNPAVDRFQIKNDKGVAGIEIYNIVGKQIMQSSHTSNQTHDVSDLDEGIYLVRMLDNTQKSLKVIRLTKD